MFSDLNGPFPRMPWRAVFPLEKPLEDSRLRKGALRGFSALKPSCNFPIFLQTPCVRGSQKVRQASRGTGRTRAPSCELWRRLASVSSANKGLPLPLGRGVCETKSKNGRSRPRKPFISRVFCAQRVVETMVSDHGLGRGQTMG